MNRSRNIGHAATASVCVDRNDFECVCVFWHMLYSEDILACPHNFKGLFYGLRLGFELRIELCLG